MAKAEPTESPLESATGAAGPHEAEAFGLLGDETRLAILLALWEEYDPHADDNAVPFSCIFDIVDHSDPGNLRYHLEKLQDQFIRQRAAGEGYELRETGMKLVRTVIAGAGVGEATMEPTEINQPCLRCGASTAIRYREGCLFWACTECQGPTPEATDIDGFLSATPLYPAGLANRTPSEIHLASIAKARYEKQMMFDGFCPDCSGSVDGWLECCSDHDSVGICEHCGTEFPVWAHFECQVCKRHGISSPKTLVLFHPTVIAFYNDHGVSLRLQADGFEGARRIFDSMHHHGLAVCSEEPLRVDVTVQLDGDGLRLAFDERASIVEVDRFNHHGG